MRYNIAILHNIFKQEKDPVLCQKELINQKNVNTLENMGL